MLSMLVLAVVCAVGIVLAVLLCLLATCLLCRGGSGRKASVDIKAYQAVNDCKPPSSVCVTSTAAFLANLKSSSSSPSPARQAREKSHQLSEQVAKNNNESGSEDLQIYQESQAAQSRPCSVSASSRASTRTDHVTDDNSSISTRSDVSADSSSFDHSFGSIRPDLYPRKDIVLQQSSLDAGQGRLHTRLKYDFRTCDLVVHLIEAQDLPVPDPASGTFGDPYIRVSLVPCVDERVRQSSVKRRTVNPYFNEYFKFPLDFDDLKEKSLIFHLFDYDRFSRHTPVGEVEICMADVDVSNSVEMWCDIQRQHKVIGESGEILISLSYLPAAERLTTVVMKARELRLPTAAATADPFVRVSLIVDGRKIKRKKTSVKRGSINPVWNEALSFNVPAEVLPKVTLEVTVLDHDLIGHGEMLGRCFIGGTEEGHDHWKDMLTNQRKSVAMWHILRK